MFAFKTLKRGFKVCSEQSIGVPDDQSNIKSEKNTLIWSHFLEEGDVSSIMKMYRNRGIISWCREHIFRFRVQREFETLFHLKNNRIPCSEPLFWTYGNSPHLGRFEILATREISNTIPLDEFLQQRNGTGENQTISPLLEIVRRMHGVGCYHGALYGRNILVKVEKGLIQQFYIIDTPQAIIFPRDIFGTRMACFDLLFLLQSLKHCLDQTSVERLMQGYGIYGSALRRFQERLANHHATKHLRNRLRAEFGLRSRLEHLSQYFSPPIKITK